MGARAWMSARPARDPRRRSGHLARIGNRKGGHSYPQKSRDHVASRPLPRRFQDSRWALHGGCRMTGAHGKGNATTSNPSKAGFSPVSAGQPDAIEPGTAINRNGSNGNTDRSSWSSSLRHGRSRRLVRRSNNISRGCQGKARHATAHAKGGLESR